MGKIARDLNGMLALKPKKRLAFLERQLSDAASRLEASILESQQWVTQGGASVELDTEDPTRDDGSDWDAIGVDHSVVPRTEQQLRKARNASRQMAATNVYAIGALENRVSFTVGTGIDWEPTWLGPADDESETLTQRIKDALRAFDEASEWPNKEQEAARRADRDGEWFMRYFRNARGPLNVRWTEPVTVSAPSGLTAADPRSFGVETDARDQTKVVAYHVDGERVPALEIEHHKLNVDETTKRGWPTLIPVKDHLTRGNKLLRNMGHVSALQAAIALIRKHETATQSEVQTFLANRSDATLLNTTTGRTNQFKYFGPGAIVDQGPGYSYQAPISSVNASNGIAVLQAELRACAARLVMPEYMFTADASNANYSSTMVAESPAVRNLERLQSAHINRYRRVRKRVIANEVLFGRLPEEALTMYDLQGEGPALVTRKRLEEAQANAIEAQAGVLSKRTWRMESGRDNETEETNLENEGAQALEDGLTGPLGADGDPNAPMLGLDGLPTGPVQDTALNGTQATALLAIVQAVVDGQLPDAAARAIVAASFPAIPQERVDDMISAAASFTPDPPATPPGLGGGLARGLSNGLPPKPPTKAPKMPGKTPVAEAARGARAGLPRPPAVKGPAPVGGKNPDRLGVVMGLLRAIVDMHPDLADELVMPPEVDPKPVEDLPEPEPPAPLDPEDDPIEELPADEPEPEPDEEPPAPPAPEPGAVPEAPPTDEQQDEADMLRKKKKAKKRAAKIAKGRRVKEPKFPSPATAATDTNTPDDSSDGD